ncbi:hypothetical protein NSQ90_00500 [Paenibacillus sp. FSL H7-0737]|uniref:hypothetical protein n=1 Tax=Paenibacillus TaxID=44249 RepID=UPI0004F73B96|nr:MULTISPECIES: hypothetical protein [Paenibacillus]AIQ21481.1 hypothetical protein H70737_00525 [Paenibacillus sp. FSL H7-0737]OMD70443.1 hypothetical protein BSK50_27830 [Paenibacillus odorifer]
MANPEKSMLIVETGTKDNHKKIIKEDEQERASQSKQHLKPSLDEITTFRHALKLLNQRELTSIINKNKIKLPSDAEKFSEIVYALERSFGEGILSKEIFHQFRQAAFNPDLDTTDGFFMSFNYKFEDMSENLLNSKISEWKKATKQKKSSERESFDAEIKLLDSGSNSKGSLFKFTRKNERFIYNNQNMLSKNYFEIQQVVVEIYFDKQIVYFQTSNSVKFHSIKTIVLNFLRFLADDEHIKIKLSAPTMSKLLKFAMSENGRSAKVYDNINPNTIKLLDLFLEIENSRSFSSFQCVDIKFDHEDSMNKDLKDRIKSQAYGCDIGDLFNKSEVKVHILSNRVILQIEFRIVYTTYDAEEVPLKHTILAGIVNDKSKANALRIYIENNEHTIKDIIKDAYKDLKDVFMGSLMDSNLKNEEKIKKMLGI